ncbi:hypothetical protein V2E24_02635 [Mycoplasmopsis ciconiae]|uniref:Uncharacterized protein n=1 Tax=Mycoplasmopsis ciconiae TaxID=561067 RepID=A0ABU7MLZ4_9BACT|nr:hypothetical protein [Mycoplasmopsis ciconiae]
MVLWLVSSLVVFLMVIFLALTIFLVYLLGARTSRGLIIFKVDTINKRVLRLTKKDDYFSTLFDNKKSKFETFNYIELNDFLNFFDKKLSKELKDYFLKQMEYKSEFRFSPNKEFIYKNLSFVERMLFKLDVRNKRLANTQYFLKVTPQNNQIYICNISWKVIEQKREINLSCFANETNTNFQKFLKGPYISINILVNPYFFAHTFNQNELDTFLKSFNLKAKKISYFFRDGIIILILNKPSKRKMKEIVNKIEWINKNSLFDGFIDKISLVNFNRISDLDSFDELLNKCKYTLYNLKNNNDIKTYSSYNDSLEEQEKIQNFINKLNEFIDKNNFGNYSIVKNRLVNYRSKHPTNTFFPSTWINGMQKEDLNFFYRIPYLVHQYENNWNKAILENSQAEIANNEKVVIQISQENYLTLKPEDCYKNVTYLVYAFSDLVYYDELKNRINLLRESGTFTALYVQKISKPVMYLLNNTNLKMVVISKDITQNLCNQKTFFDCLNVYHLTKIKKMSLIYEIPNHDLDPYTVMKVGIKGVYKPEFKVLNV